MFEGMGDAVAKLLPFAAATLESSFATALLGAFFGAAAANHFAVNNARKNALQERLLASNAATNFAIASFNHAIGFKAQLRPVLYENYFADRERYISFLREIKAEKKTFTIQYDFSPVRGFNTNAEKLLELVSHRAGASQTAIVAAANLVQILASLEAFLSKRTEQLSRLAREKAECGDEEFAHRFFGLEEPNGNIDTRLYDAVDAVRQHLEDAIFFSAYIAEKLSEQNRALSRKIGKGSPDPATFAIDERRLKDLMPNRSDYSD
ncbi:hypothetical protein [Sulfitobacter sp. 1A12779]|uniref:hypothetical protein n=1 Tax=Sulfitobacter sp. 1A12779 TaxID=3368599 RepID=UPI00374730DF